MCLGDPQARADAGDIVGENFAHFAVDDFYD
jgi:hypothetical protein